MSVGKYSNPMEHMGVRLVEVDMCFGTPFEKKMVDLLRNRGSIAGFIKGNQWLTIPDHKALFLGVGYVRGL